MKKIIVFLLAVLLLTGCSSGSAASQDSLDNNAAEGTYGGYIIEPTADDEDDAHDAGGQQTTDSGDLWIPDESSSGSSSANQELFDVSKLSFEDFDEFYGQIMYEGIPEDRVSLPLGYANGVWRYDLKIRNDSSDGYLFDELGYAEMSVHNEDDPPVTIVLHPRLASDGYEVWEETDEEVGYEPFGGGLDENNNLKLSGNYCVLLLTHYYAYEGREYLIAELWMSEEDVATFMMMRGQE